MLKREELFHLIKSLTEREKAHFRQNVARDGAAYARLFDAINAQDSYDESALRDHFAGEPFLRQFHVLKNYLRGQLLAAFSAQELQSSPESRCRRQLSECEFLYARGLWSFCSRHLKAGLEKARELEMWPDALSYLALKRRLANESFSRKQRDIELRQVLHEETKIQRIIEQENRFRIMSTQLFESLSDPPHALRDVLEGKEKPLSLTAATQYHFMRQTWFAMHNDRDACLPEAEKVLQLWEEKPVMLETQGTSYLTSLNNTIGMALQFRDYQKARSLLAKADKFYRQNKTISRRAVLQLFNVELEFYRDVRDFENGLKRVATIEAFLEKHTDLPENYRLSLRYQCAYLFFLAADYEAALRHLNRVLNDRFVHPREDILAFAHLLYLIIHFELGNMNLLRYAVESCRRFLKKKRMLHSYERVLLNGFSRLSTSTKDQHPRILSQIEENLFKDESEETRSNVLDYLDFKSWIAERLNAG